jgi:uncharacterized protein (DUF849 family)
MRPVIITCAVTGGGDTVGKNPAVPVTPEQIASAAVAASAAGAAVVHIHARDPRTGGPSLDPALFREIFQRIRAVDDQVIVNLTTGEGGMIRLGAGLPSAAELGAAVVRPIDRAAHVLELHPDMCSLDMGTLNFGDDLFVNTPRDIADIAELAAQARARVELEVFDTGHIELAKQLLERKVLAAPPLFQLCLGIRWGAPASIESMLHMRDMLPREAVWAAFGIGPAQFPMVAAAALLGGHVRVGLEDNLYLDRGTLAPSNAALVERAAAILRSLGYRPAGKPEARVILGL